MPKLLQVGGDRGIQLRSLGLLLPQRRGEALHLLLELLDIILRRFGADVTARREHVAMLADFVKCRRLAEPAHVDVVASSLVAPPRMVGAGNLGYVLVGEFAVCAVDQCPHLAGIEKQNLATPVPEAAILLVAGE